MAELKRTLGLPAITLYGLGTILGAGIYVVVGEVAGHAGMGAPLSFLLAAFVAGLTGLSFGELVARHPESAGEAAYVQAAFGMPALSAVVGLLITLTGVVSAAAIANGFTGYLRVFVEVPDGVGIVGLLLLLGALAAWGIEESVAVAAVLTLLEVAGLLLVLFVASGSLGTLPARLPELVPTAETLPGVGFGAFLAFYAFVGFEDMVNEAEEVRDPGRTLPLAILGALVAATALYAVVALVCVLALTPAELAASDRPLALVYERSTGRSPLLISGISLFAVANGALVQIVMGSRVLYGLAKRGWLPGALAQVNGRTQTPLLATAVVTAAVLVLALLFDLSALAQVTSAVILGVFALVNLALWRIKRDGSRSPGPWTLPRWLPLATAALIVSFLAFRLWSFVG